MPGVGATVRLLMLATCLVPFTSTRQAAVLVPTSPASSTPMPAPAPVSEEEETEREQGGAGKDKARKYAPPANSPSVVPTRPLHAHASTARSTSPTRSPAPTDPFRNGLGCPFRC